MLARICPLAMCSLGSFRPLLDDLSISNTRDKVPWFVGVDKLAV